MADLPRIEVPTLVIGARHDTMDPAYMERMAKALPKGATSSARTAATWRCTTTEDVFEGLVRFLRGRGRRA